MSEAMTCSSCNGAGTVESRGSSTSFTSAEPVVEQVKCSACSGHGVGRPATWQDLRAYYDEPLASENEIFGLAKACAEAMNLDSSVALINRHYEYMEDGRDGATFYERGSEHELAYCLHPDGSLGVLRRTLPSHDRRQSSDSWSAWEPVSLQDVSDFLMEFDFVASWQRCSDGWCDDNGWLDRGNDVGTIARSSSESAFERKSNTTSFLRLSRHFAKGDGLLRALRALTS